jgi:hypothetical protein
MASLCREFEISRVTGYKIYERYNWRAAINRARPEQLLPKNTLSASSGHIHSSDDSNSTGGWERSRPSRTSMMRRVPPMIIRNADVIFFDPRHPTIPSLLLPAFHDEQQKVLESLGGRKRFPGFHNQGIRQKSFQVTQKS